MDQKVQAVKEILDKDHENIDRLRPAHEALVETLTKIGTAMYQAAGADGAAAGGTDFGTNGAGEAGPEAEDETTVEGEFREVGSDR